MKTWLQLAEQQSKTFTLSQPLIIGQTYTISMNSNESFMISVGDVFVGETVDGSLEFIATNSGDVMVTSYDDISMEFEIKLERGNIATDWSPAPEDVEIEITKSNRRIDTADESIQEFTTQIKDLEDNIIEQKTYYHYDDDGLTIGSDKWDSNIHINGEGIDFKNPLGKSLANFGVDGIDFKSPLGESLATFGVDGMYVNKWLTDLHTIEKFDEGGIRGTLFRDRREED